MAVINIFCDTDVFESPKWTALHAVESFFFYICTTVFAEIINILYYNLLRNVHVMGNLIRGGNWPLKIKLVLYVCL